ncbi:MAG: sporulation protein YunB [Clostridiales bacterium]|nr:sporulation protein YunB [Clostridiales bacterium]
MTAAGVLKLIDSRVVPAAEEAALVYSSDYINQKIDEITAKIISDKNIAYSDFYSITENENGISSIIINSLLVNEICAETAAELSSALTGGTAEKITLSLGLITGFKILSNCGPKINVRLVPMGAVMADYETDLADSGINSVNYKVYLNIKTNVKIISPLCSRPFEITRKYMLADVVFTGAVPDTYLRRQ